MGGSSWDGLCLFPGQLGDVFTDVPPGVLLPPNWGPGLDAGAWLMLLFLLACLSLDWMTPWAACACSLGDVLAAVPPGVVLPSSPDWEPGLNAVAWLVLLFLLACSPEFEPGLDAVIRLALLVLCCWT